MCIYNNVDDEKIVITFFLRKFCPNKVIPRIATIVGSSYM